MTEPEDAFDRPAAPVPAPRRTRSRTMHHRVSLNVGEVVRNTFSTIVRTPMLVVLTIVMMGIPAGLHLVSAHDAWRAGPRTREEIGQVPPLYALLAVSEDAPVRYLGDVQVRAGLLHLVVNEAAALLLQCMLIYAVFRALQGRPGGLGRAVRTGFARFFPVLGTVLIVGVLSLLAGGAGGMIAGLLGIVGGMMGMIVMATLGGVIGTAILRAILFVSIVVCVVERRGPGRSIGRSAWLTQGARGKIFGVALVVVLAAEISDPIFALAVPAWPSSLASGMAIVAGAALVQMLVALVSAVLAVVMYRDLRVAKEGVEVDELVRVFE